MKKIDNVFHKVKTAGAVAGLALTLNSCSNIKKDNLNSEDCSRISLRTDSVLQTMPMYRLSTSIDEFIQRKLPEYHELNKDLVREYAMRYVARNIKDIDLRMFMTDLLQKEYLYEYVADAEESGDYEYQSYKAFQRIIRNDYRWFNDVMLYLTNQYTDDQFLKTDFFKIIKDERAYQIFKQNAEYTKNLQNLSRTANNHLVKMYDDVWEQQKEEYKKSKQR